MSKRKQHLSGIALILYVRDLTTYDKLTSKETFLFATKPYTINTYIHVGVINTQITYPSLISYPLRSLSSMDSLSKQQDAYPLLLCPYNFFRKEEEDYRFVQFGESPTIIPSFSDEWHSGPLKLCINIEGKYVHCEVCRIDMLPATTYYSCNKCRFSRTKAYHKEYIEPIPEHPYHPKHSLRLVSNYRHIYGIIPEKKCICCSRCHAWFYNFFICDFIMCSSCARKPPVLAIDHPKRHKHALFYFLRKESLTCDICALNHHESLIYSCHQCYFCST